MFVKHLDHIRAAGLCSMMKEGLAELKITLKNYGKLMKHTSY